MEFQLQFITGSTSLKEFLQRILYTSPSEGLS